MVNFDKLQTGAQAVTTLAIIVVIAIAVLNQIKNAGLVENSSVDAFINGLLLFGTFLTLLVVVLIGKQVIAEMKEK